MQKHGVGASSELYRHATASNRHTRFGARIKNDFAILLAHADLDGAPLRSEALNYVNQYTRQRMVSARYLLIPGR